MRIDEAASAEKYRLDKQFQNFAIFRILIFFEIKKILKMC